MKDIAAWFKHLTASMAKEGTLSSTIPTPHMRDLPVGMVAMATEDNTPSDAATAAHMADVAPSMATDNNMPSDAPQVDDVAPPMATDDNTPSDAAPEAHMANVAPSTATDDNTPNAATPAAHMEDVAPPPMATDDNTPSDAATAAQVPNSIQVKKRKPRTPSINVMGKTQLINEVAETANLKKTQAERAVNALLAAMREALVCGEDVGLPGLGVFWTVERKERIARNPQTGETMKIPERRVVNFKAGQKLKEIIIGSDKIHKDL